MNKPSKSKKEAKYTLLLYSMYFSWSVCFAYFLGSGDPNDYTLIFGFPAWFFFSCIIAYPLCCVAVYVLILKIFSKNDETE